MAGRRPRRRNVQRGAPTRRAGRRRRLALSILIAVVLLESGLRILLGNFGQSKILQRSDDPEICIELQPEVQMLYTGWRARVAPSRMVINSYGIRGPELEERAEKGVLRIGALGDS
ncbi:MAG: hypothetical protein VX498_16030, partial [Myxococcota bacterium]|nr:hypothetical protein [Myxococcota bacterium]